MTPATPIPVVVLSGFLGAGKTTLLRTMLTGDPATAVIVNEYGDVSLDHRLLRGCAERVEVVSGGCACCVRRTDLVAVLSALLDDHERGRAELHGVVIETSGLADPAPILFTVTGDPMLRHHFDVVRVVVCVDAQGGSRQLAAHPEVLKQVAVADELVLTKADLVEPAVCADLAERLAHLNPAARVVTARNGLRDTVAIAEPDASRRAARRRPHPDVAAGHVDDTASLFLSPRQPLDWLAFAVWLSMLLAAWGEQVLRVKGLVELEDGSFVSLNSVQHVVHAPEHLSAQAVADGAAGIVFITRGLPIERLKDSLERFQRLSGVPTAVPS